MNATKSPSHQSRNFGTPKKFLLIWVLIECLMRLFNLKGLPVVQEKYVNYVMLCQNYVTLFDRFNLFLIDKKNDEINHDKINRNTQRIRTKK